MVRPAVGQSFSRALEFSAGCAILFPVDVKARVNLYIFTPHPLWAGVNGCMGVAARDFQRAEKIALRYAEQHGLPAYAFGILDDGVSAENAPGFWSEVERYRDVDDEERLVFASYGEPALAPAG